jgi:hypothetical protein
VGGRAPCDRSTQSLSTSGPRAQKAAAAAWLTPLAGVRTHSMPASSRCRPPIPISAMAQVCLPTRRPPRLPSQPRIGTDCESPLQGGTLQFPGLAAQGGFAPDCRRVNPRGQHHAGALGNAGRSKWDPIGTPNQSRRPARLDDGPIGSLGSVLFKVLCPGERAAIVREWREEAGGLDVGRLLDGFLDPLTGRSTRLGAEHGCNPERHRLRNHSYRAASVARSPLNRSSYSHVPGTVGTNRKRLLRPRVPLSNAVAGAGLDKDVIV